MLMDPLHFSIAFIPIAGYMLLMAWINLSPRPMLTTGARDMATLAAAMLGLAIVGPMELFLPESLAALIRGWTWIPMILLYALIVTLLILSMRPRLIVYNFSKEELRPELQQAIAEIDPHARWAGDSVILPDRGIQLAVESNPAMRNVALVSVGVEQHWEGWNALRCHLSQRLRACQAPVNMQGLHFLFLAGVLMSGVIYSLYHGRHEILNALQDMLRL